jgi:hypothetical protein
MARITNGFIKNIDIDPVKGFKQTNPSEGRQGVIVWKQAI